MKNVLFVFVSLLLTWNSHGQSTKEIEELADGFFKKNVSNGQVNYLALSASKQELGKLVGIVGRVNLSTASPNAKKAFYVNAYNLLVIHQVVENYPIGSVMDVGGFFDQKKFLVAGEKMTLNALENEKIRKQYNDPRFHFVLVCGAVSCPPIIDKAYKESTIEQQLEQQTSLALNDPKFIQSNNEATQISEIFNWYKSDFEVNGGSVKKFINRYRKSKIPENEKLGYYTYDWKLNEDKNSKGSIVPKESAPSNRRSIDLQQYTPSVLLTKGQWEFKTFGNLYTQKGGYDQNTQYIDYGNRSTFFTSINEFTYGINRRFNVGADLWIKAVLYDEPGSSPLEVFKFQTTPQSRTELSVVGPRIRIQPIKNWKHFALNSSFLIPIASDQNGSESSDRAWLSQDAYLWITKFYYDQSLGNKFQLFLQLAPWFTIQKPGESAKNKLETPFDVFFNYFATSRLSFYMQQEFWPSFSPDGNLTSYFLQGGLGSKFQVIKGLLELELSYTNFYFGMNSGAGQTFNLGIRIISGSK
ncbi:MAG: hypothetical protein CL840_18485 [Crocinitomicaceae bacterium]|nr:hypothetical protein [Crocinitomicaceae bacterium]|tara:strand:+ start:24224 stop:25804 length:1581 start_codon:yes stop_codon:yes gene_type:complete